MTIKENDNLAAVLERINLLMQTVPIVAEESQNVDETLETEDDIPELLEIYTGSPAQLVSQASRQKKVDALLKEMRPLIELEAKKAVLQESVELEKFLAKKLEVDLIKILRDRLMALE